ncbi:acyl-CoA dehydrogenase family protein [Ferroplasma sp.]|uniref:acyl-CoA dehydrogenase family protein n=1 Tax=Ferroplasma sp. TaxID=2591003 RepID=UPI00307F15D4
MKEENQILKQTIDEFCEKELDEKKIESTGITVKITELLASQGFLGAVIPGKYSGSELDNTSYQIILEETARYSPSVAMKIFVLNSLYYPSVEGTSEEYSLEAAASGKLNVAVDFINNSSELKENAGKLSGTLKNILGLNADKIVLFNGNTSIVNEPFKTNVRDFMGFRGIQFGDVELSHSAKLLDRNNRRSEIMEKAYGAVNAIALGMISEALKKAIDYTSVRKAFGNYLKDFEPISFRLSRFRATESVLRNALYSNVDPYYTFNVAMEAMVEIARYSVNTHGGYGYFQDFGVEKFYRDAIVMKSIFYGNEELKKLADHVYSEKINFV